MKTSQRYYGTSKRHMTFTLLLINSLSQIFYLMSAMPSEGLNAKNKATMMLLTKFLQSIKSLCVNKRLLDWGRLLV